MHPLETVFSASALTRVSSVRNQGSPRRWAKLREHLAGSQSTGKRRLRPSTPSPAPQQLADMPCDISILRRHLPRLSFFVPGLPSPALIAGRSRGLISAHDNVVLEVSGPQSFAQLEAFHYHMTDRKDSMMRTSILVVAACLAVALSAPAYSQGAPQTVTLMKVDPQSLATGYRTSKVVGSTVVNEANETIGSIDDLIVTPGGQAPYAVLSVGGFLGIGTKYVVVPFTALKIVDKKIVLPGGTKDALKALPEFKYNS